MKNGIVIFYTSFIIILISSFTMYAGEVNSWDCNKFENANIVGDGDVYLGKLGPRWISDSIFNSSSSYSSTWSSESIYNTSSIYGSSYSNTSVFNESAINPPVIVSSAGFVGYLSIGPSWDAERFSPYDIKYTCDWD